MVNHSDSPVGRLGRNVLIISYNIRQKTLFTQPNWEYLHLNFTFKYL